MPTALKHDNETNFRFITTQNVHCSHSFEIPGPSNFLGAVVSPWVPLNSFI